MAVQTFLPQSKNPRQNAWSIQLYLDFMRRMLERPNLGDLDFILNSHRKHSVNYLSDVRPYCAQRKKEKPGPAKNCERNQSYNALRQCALFEFWWARLSRIN